MTASILIIDDEAPVRNAMQALLERSGYQAHAVGSTFEALIWLREHPNCDLVLSDVMMPGEDGISLLDQICSAAPQMPVVMLTAVQDVNVVTAAFRHGAIDYLMKPFDRVQLLTVVERALDHGRTQKQKAIYRESLERMISTRTSRLRATMLDLEKSYDVTLEAMGAALDLRDAETEGHSRRVTAYTVALARELNLSAEDLRTISRGAFLHDIGKIATPDAILLKPGSLSTEEREVMREHCVRGYEMIRKIPFLRDAAEIIYAHQECFDGSGYPRGLSGEGIPLGARIFAIADALDAMTSDRPYRRAITFSEARLEIARGAGAQFDPYIVDVFLGMPEDIWSDLRAEVQHAPPTVFNARSWRTAEVALSGMRSEL